MIWTTVSNLATQIEAKFASSGQKIIGHETEYDWYNAIYTSRFYRRAHLEIVDKRESHKIFIVHSTIFPHYNDPSPIWGFDAVCGPNKITGAFHDFSSGGEPNHFMMRWFAQESKSYTWNKPRNLPFWAQQIFSPAMIAAGNVQTEQEVGDLCDIVNRSLDYYLANVGQTQEWPFEYHMAQNRYCYYQKQNPHVINSMVSMGVPRDRMEQFVHNVLFPTIDKY